MLHEDPIKSLKKFDEEQSLLLKEQLDQALNAFKPGFAAKTPTECTA